MSWPSEVYPKNIGLFNIQKSPFNKLRKIIPSIDVGKKIWENLVSISGLKNNSQQNKGIVP